MIRRRGGLLIVALVAGVAATLLAKPGIVKTREGQVYDGDVVDVEGSESVTVTVRGISTDIPRANVVSVTYGQGIDADYQERLAKLDEKDAKGRMELAKWAFFQKRYDLARDAADKALDVDPNHAEAVNFLTLVQSQQRMERARDRAATAPAVDDAATTRRTVADRPDFPLLTDMDINRIRQEELRLADVRVRFQFRHDVERRFLSANRDLTLLDWRALTPIQRAINILDRGDPQLRDDVVVVSEPLAIQEYRRLVQPLVQANCSTSSCHGGLTAGRLVLNSSADVNEEAAYTNFYIMGRYKQQLKSIGDQQGVFGGGTVERRMIDRTRAEDSLLLQYGLPRNLARIPHPDVQNLRPAFPRGREDTKYQAIARWIGFTLAPVEPNYGIDYHAPVGARPVGATLPVDRTPAATTDPAKPIRRR